MSYAPILQIPHALKTRCIQKAGVGVVYTSTWQGFCLSTCENLIIHGTKDFAVLIRISLFPLLRRSINYRVSPTVLILRQAILFHLAHAQLSLANTLLFAYITNFRLH